MTMHILHVHVTSNAGAWPDSVPCKLSLYFLFYTGKHAITYKGLAHPGNMVVLLLETKILIGATSPGT